MNVIMVYVTLRAVKVTQSRGAGWFTVAPDIQQAVTLKTILTLK